MSDDRATLIADWTPYQRRCTSSPFTLDDIFDIRCYVDEGWTVIWGGHQTDAIARLYGVHRRTIRSIGARRVYRWLPEESGSAFSDTPAPTIATAWRLTRVRRVRDPWRRAHRTRAEVYAIRRYWDTTEPWTLGREREALTRFGGSAVCLRRIGARVAYAWLPEEVAS
jgi:hypothetical protein